MAVFDTHAHYDSGSFSADREEVLSALPGAGVALVVNPGCDVPSSQAALALAERFPHIYAAVGIHPEDCAGCTDADFEAVRALCAHEKVVAIGEIGLDYYWKENPPRDFQEQVFRRQIELALELDLPVIIHSRDAAKDTLDMMKAAKAGDIGGVVHCFSYTREMAREYLNMGFFLGIGGVLTFNNARKLKEVVEYIPLESIVLETDCPYLAPVPNRGKRNSSLNLPYVVEAVSQLKGVDPETVVKVTWENGKRLYRL